MSAVPGDTSSPLGETVELLRYPRISPKFPLTNMSAGFRTKSWAGFPPSDLEILSHFSCF